VVRFDCGKVHDLVSKRRRHWRVCEGAGRRETGPAGDAGGWSGLGEGLGNLVLEAYAEPIQSRERVPAMLD
jgi:hypothetical protein